jgi:hypothetical protein
MARAKVHTHDVIHGVAVIVTGRIGGGKEMQIAADGQKWPPPWVADDGEEDEQQQQPGHFFGAPSPPQRINQRSPSARRTSEITWL